MPRDQLLGLATDTDRLLAAGVAAVAGHDGLRRRAKALRDLAGKVSAVAPVADAAERAVTATPKAAAAAFLDLVTTGRQLRASLASVGLMGELTPPPAGGPWRTPLAARDLHPLLEALTGSGSGREDTLRQAHQHQSAADLRLAGPLLAALGDGNAVLAELVASEVLPAQGPGVLPELLAALNLQGKAADARRIQAVCKLDPQAGADLCRRALAEGSDALKVQALECLPAVGRPGEAEQAGLAHCRDKKGDIRRAALLALRGSKGDAALDALVEALSAADYATYDTAQDILKELPHPGTAARLLREVPAKLAAQAQAEAAVAEAKKAKKKGAGPKAQKGKSAPDPVAKAEVAVNDLAVTLSRVLTALAGRAEGDATALAAALLPLARHKNNFVVEAAVTGLGRAVGGSPEVMPTLLSFTTEKSRHWSKAFTALEQVPPPLRPQVLPTLLSIAKAAKHPHKLVALRVLALYFGSHPDRVRSALREALAGANEAARKGAIAGLKTLGPPAREFLPDLLDLVARGKGYGEDLDEAFAAIEPDGRESIPRLTELLQSKKSRVRGYACHCLKWFRKPELVPVLEPLTGDKDPSVCCTAIWAVQFLTSGS
jgi:hypothetical protein